MSLKALVAVVVVGLTVSACGVPPLTVSEPAASEQAKGIAESSFTRDLPVRDLDSIPIGGVSASSFEGVTTSGLPLILPSRVPVSQDWELDTDRIFLSKDASGGLVSYGYFLVGGPRSEPQEVLVEVGSARVVEDGTVRPADYAPAAPELGLLAGRPAHRVEATESISFVIETYDYTVTFEVFRQCSAEDPSAIGEGICLSWGDVRRMISSMVVVNS